MGTTYNGNLYSTSTAKLASYLSKVKGVRTLDQAPKQGRRVMISNLAMLSEDGITNLLNGLGYGISYYIVINGTKYPLVKTGNTNFTTSLKIK